MVEEEIRLIADDEFVRNQGGKILNLVAISD